MKGKELGDAVERAREKNLTNQEKFQKLFKEDQEVDESREIDNYMEVQDSSFGIPQEKENAWMSEEEEVDEEPLKTPLGTNNGKFEFSGQQKKDFKQANRSMNRSASKIKTM